MICAIYERRPPSTRLVTDPRAAKPVEQFKFEDYNVMAIKDHMKESGYRIACNPSKVQGPEFDFVAYIEPRTADSPKKLLKKKPVQVGGASGIKRRHPVPVSRRHKR